MKPRTLLSLVLAMSASIASFGQQKGNAVVFTEMGEKITVYLNGVKQNEAPASNVRMEGLKAQPYQARIDFEDASLADFTNNYFAVEAGAEITGVVKQNRKGKYVLRFQGASPITTTQVVTAEEPRTQPIVEKTIVRTTGDVGSTMNTTTVTETSLKDGAKVDVKVGGIEMKVDMEIDGMVIDQELSTTVTESSSSTVVNGGTIVEEDVEMEMDCGISRASFATISQSVKSKDFEDSKLTVAKQAVGRSCPTSVQVRDLMRAFDFEDTRLEFAKFAFSKVADPSNYYMVNDAFEFEITIDELNAFINK